MKSNFLLVLLIFFGLQMTCSKEMPADYIQLQSCSEMKFAISDEIKICYDSLLTDCRCPLNAVCIWEGVAEAKFSISTKDGTARFILSTIDRYGYRNMIDTLGYRIELLDIQPYPGATASGPKNAIVKLWKF